MRSFSLRDWFGVLAWMLSAFGLGISPFIARDWSNLATALVAHISIWFGACTLSFLIHEFAHFVVAGAVGMKVWCVNAGEGRIIYDREFSNFRFILRAWPWAGSVWPVSLATDAAQVRRQWTATLAAGPLSNAALLAAMLVLALSRRSFLNLTFFEGAMAVANALLLILNVLPLRTKLNGSICASDGLNVLQLLLARKINAPKVYLGLAGSSPAVSPVPPSWRWQVKHMKLEPMLAGFRKQLGSATLSQEKRCELLDAFATAVIMFGSREFLAEADKFSEELLRTKPVEITVKGTRGSVLIDLEQVEAGMTMLKEVMNNNPSAFDGAICASFLGLAEFKRGNIDSARNWAAKARKLDPNCGALLRIEPLLEEKAQIT